MVFQTQIRIYKNSLRQIGSRVNKYNLKIIKEIEGTSTIT